MLGNISIIKAETHKTRVSTEVLERFNVGLEYKAISNIYTTRPGKRELMGRKIKTTTK